MCDKTSTIKANFNVHLMEHAEEKPYNCSQCDKAFTHKCNLTTHLRIHTGEKPYPCNLCDFFFKQKSVRSHKRIHTGEKPYQYIMCNKVFRVKGHLVVQKQTCPREKPRQSEVWADLISCRSQLNSYKRNILEFTLDIKSNFSSGDLYCVCFW